MSKVTAVITFLGAFIIFTLGTAFGADGQYYEERNANRCFDETVKVANGADPATLSTFRCRQALRADMLGRENKSAILFNLGIIQRAQGDLAAAQASFAKAASLSRTIDRRNLALAEVSRELGDHRVAMEQYDLLTTSDLVAGSEKLRAAVSARRQDADAGYFASIEATTPCTSCHGADGISVNPEAPSLAGRHEDSLEFALQQYKNGQRHHALMTPQAKLVAEEDVAYLAQHFASLDRPGMTRDW